MYQKPYTCIEINVLLHFSDLRALILRYNNVRAGAAPQWAIPGLCPLIAACAPQTKILSPSEDFAPKKITCSVPLECNSRPETFKILVITAEIVGKNCVFTDFAMKTFFLFFFLFFMVFIPELVEI